MDILKIVYENYLCEILELSDETISPTESYVQNTIRMTENNVFFCILQTNPFIVSVCSPYYELAASNSLVCKVDSAIRDTWVFFPMFLNEHNDMLKRSSLVGKVSENISKILVKCFNGELKEFPEELKGPELINYDNSIQKKFFNNEKERFHKMISKHPLLSYIPIYESNNEFKLNSSKVLKSILSQFYMTITYSISPLLATKGIKTIQKDLSRKVNIELPLSLAEKFKLSAYITNNKIVKFIIEPHEKNHYINCDLELMFSEKQKIIIHFSKDSYEKTLDNSIHINIFNKMKKNITGMI